MYLIRKKKLCIFLVKIYIGEKVAKAPSLLFPRTKLTVNHQTTASSADIKPHSRFLLLPHGRSPLAFPQLESKGANNFPSIRRTLPAYPSRLRRCYPAVARALTKSYGWRRRRRSRGGGRRAPGRRGSGSGLLRRCRGGGCGGVRGGRGRRCGVRRRGGWRSARRRVIATCQHGGHRRQGNPLHRRCAGCLSRCPKGWAAVPGLSVRGVLAWRGLLARQD